MKELKVRFYNDSDIETFVSWFNSTPNNLHDPAITAYPTLRILCAYDDENGPASYLPTQKVVMLESLAVRPGLRPLEAAAAFRDLVKAAEITASAEGIKELYFPCSDEDVIKVAERHGFEVLPWKVLRMRLK